jgi:hypothetical protein
MNKALQVALVDLKIALYELSDGDECASILLGASFPMHLVIAASRGTVKPELTACLTLCLKLIKSNSYEAKYTPTIDAGLDLALGLAAKVNNKAIAKAYKGMQHVTKLPTIHKKL